MGAAGFGVTEHRTGGAREGFAEGQAAVGGWSPFEGVARSEKDDDTRADGHGQVRDARIGSDEKGGASQNGCRGGKIEPAAEVDGAGGAGDFCRNGAVGRSAHQDAGQSGTVAQGGCERNVAVCTPTLARD